jgi:hypothetical protein
MKKHRQMRLQLRLFESLSRSELADICYGQRDSFEREVYLTKYEGEQGERTV